MVKNAKQAHKRKMASKGFKVLLDVLDSLNLEFGTRHNTKFTKKDFAIMLLTMAEHGCSANSAHERGPQDVEMASGDWGLKKLRKKTFHEMEASCSQMLFDTASFARSENGSKLSEQTVAAAIDKHKIAHHDTNPNMNNLIYSKHEGGTAVFEAHITAKMVMGKKEVHLASDLVTRDKFNKEYVRGLIKKCDKLDLGISLYLLDREFCATDVMQTITNCDKDFIIPAKKTDGIKDAIKELVEGKRDAVSRYTMRSSTGETYTFNLLLIKNKAKEKDENLFKRYFAFATSLSYEDPERVVSRIPELYKKRWGIETGYKVAKSVRPYTTSKNPAIRMFYFNMSLVISNIWVKLRGKSHRGIYEIQLAVLLNLMVHVFVESIREPWPPPAPQAEPPIR